MRRLRELARGQACRVRLEGVCNFNEATTVLAHYRLAGLCGTGVKPPDLLGAWCCSACHDVIDGRTPYLYGDDERTAFLRKRLAHAEGVLRTIYKLIELGKV